MRQLTGGESEVDFGCELLECKTMEREEPRNRIGRSLGEAKKRVQMSNKNVETFSNLTSHVVTHRTTIRSRTSLTSPSGREGVHVSLI